MVISYKLQPFATHVTNQPTMQVTVLPSTAQTEKKFLTGAWKASTCPLHASEQRGYKSDEKGVAPSAGPPHCISAQPAPFSQSPDGRQGECTFPPVGPPASSHSAGNQPGRSFVIASVQNHATSLRSSRNSTQTVINGNTVIQGPALVQSCGHRLTQRHGASVSVEPVPFVVDQMMQRSILRRNGEKSNRSTNHWMQQTTTC